MLDILEMRDRDEDDTKVEEKKYFLVLHKKSDSWGESKKIRPFLYKSLSMIDLGTKFVVLSNSATENDALLVKKVLESIKNF